MRFKGLDLNLLVALDVLLDCRSVSRAAERLNLSQPAISAALSRLRHYFDDDILVANGKRMHPTAYAEGLIPQLRSCLRDLDALISSSTTFDPATSQRTFSIVASDYVTVAVLAPLVSQLVETAPGVRLEMLAPSDESSRQLAEGGVDLLITPEGFHRPGLPAEVLFSERHVIAGWKENPIFRGEVTEADVLGLGHVSVAIGVQRTPSFADREMAAMGKTRRVEVTAASFTTVPWLLLNTQRVSIMHERMARTMAGHFPIAYAPLPFDFPLMHELVQHHPARANDEGLIWMRRRLQAAANP